MKCPVCNEDGLESTKNGNFKCPECKSTFGPDLVAQDCGEIPVALRQQALSPAT